MRLQKANSHLLKVANIAGNSAENRWKIASAAANNIVTQLRNVTSFY